MAIIVRGKFYSFSSTTSIVDGEEIPAISSFDYGIKKDGAYVYGSDPLPLGQTDGKIEFSASLKMPRQAWTALKARLGPNYMFHELNWLISFGKLGQPTEKVEILKFTLQETKASGAAGSADALETELTVLPTEIIENGIRVWDANA